MVAYGIGLPPLIKRLKLAHTDIAQPWYVDDTGALCTLDNIGLYFNSLKRYGLGHGYYPEPSKSVVIVHLDNLAAGKYFGLCHGFKVCTGAR